MDVAEWLRSLGLEHCAPAFAQNHISPEILPNLTADDLKDLGVASVGHCRAILAAIDGLRAVPVPPPRSRQPGLRPTTTSLTLPRARATVFRQFHEQSRSILPSPLLEAALRQMSETGSFRGAAQRRARPRVTRATARRY
jgi:hypothetical protein